MVASPGSASSSPVSTPVSAGSRSRSPSVSSPNGGGGGGGGDPSCRVSVAVRIRPLLGQELAQGSTECIVAEGFDRKQVRIGRSFVSWSSCRAEERGLRAQRCMSRRAGRLDRLH
jgi:hypothetical protein